jgi:hypothetical protein
MKMSRRMRPRLAIKKRLKLMRKGVVPLWKRFRDRVHGAGYTSSEFTESICRRAVYDDPISLHPSWVALHIPYLANGPSPTSSGYEEPYAFEDAVLRVVRRAKRPGRGGFVMYDAPMRDIDDYIHGIIQLFGELKSSGIRDLRIARLRLIPLFNAVMRTVRDKELGIAGPRFTGIPYIDIEEKAYDLPGQTPE